MSMQLCPKCHGQGTVAKPPWVPGDVHEWTSHSTGPYVCDLCDGRKRIEFVLHDTHLPSRGSDVEAWLRDNREHARERYHGNRWQHYDDLLDEYRLRADLGLSLSDDLPLEDVGAFSGIPESTPSERGGSPGTTPGLDSRGAG